MHKNFIWQAFLIVMAAIAIWYTASAIYSYYNYSHLKVQTITSAIQWDIEEKSDEEFLIKALYTFEYQGKAFSGDTTFDSTPYRNLWAAEDEIKIIEGQNRKVWFDPQNPAHSSLQKKFPFKESFYSIILWGLVLYFLWLSFYVAKFKT